MTNNIYIEILTSILIKKNMLLEQLIEISTLQEKYITEKPLDMNKFESSISEKDNIIGQMLQQDQGFEDIYGNVRDELSGNKLLYKEDIIKLQDLIKQVTDNSIKLQAIEKRNKNVIEVYFSAKKREIKNFKISSNTVSSYYKNMANQHQGQSYFLDKKK